MFKRVARSQRKKLWKPQSTVVNGWASCAFSARGARDEDHTSKETRTSAKNDEDRGASQGVLRGLIFFAWRPSSTS